MSSQVLDQFLSSNIEDLKNKGLYNFIDTLQGQMVLLFVLTESP